MLRLVYPFCLRTRWLARCRMMSFEPDIKQWLPSNGRKPNAYSSVWRTRRYASTRGHCPTTSSASNKYRRTPSSPTSAKWEFNPTSALARIQCSLGRDLERGDPGPTGSRKWGPWVNLKHSLTWTIMLSRISLSHLSLLFWHRIWHTIGLVSLSSNSETYDCDTWCDLWEGVDFTGIYMRWDFRIVNGIVN